MKENCMILQITFSRSWYWRARANMSISNGISDCWMCRRYAYDSYIIVEAIIFWSTLGPIISDGQFWRLRSNWTFLYTKSKFLWSNYHSWQQCFRQVFALNIRIMHHVIRVESSECFRITEVSFKICSELNFTSNK